MKKYEIVKNTREFTRKNKGEICEGCTPNQDTQYPEILESYDDKEAALEALKKYESECRHEDGWVEPLWEATEYYVEESDYDEDDELVENWGVWEFAPGLVELE